MLHCCTSDLKRRDVKLAARIVLETNMADISFPGHDTVTRWRGRIRVTPVLLQRGRGLLLAFLLALGVSFVLSEATKDRCDNVLGRLAVRFKLDSYYSNSQCMTHALDFSDPCNSMYLPMLMTMRISG
jgi:hypothetical protein